MFESSHIDFLLCNSYVSLLVKTMQVISVVPFVMNGLVSSAMLGFHLWKSCYAYKNAV